MIVVKDIDRSLQFYQELFDLPVTFQSEGNIILLGGLVLQEERLWKQHITNDITHKHNAGELYFETRDMDGFLKKLEQITPAVEYLTPPTDVDAGKKIVRFYDPDGTLIEVGTVG